MSAGWSVAGASARGAAHVRTDRPNQDALAWIIGDEGTGIVAAVSDGHGAAPHFRSQVGARLAVDGATQLFQERISDLDSDIDLGRKIVERWRYDVSAEIAAEPYSAAEKEIAHHNFWSPYGATLIAFSATMANVTALQIGDGDLMLGYPDGHLVRAIDADAGLVGEETYSLCMPDAAARVRSARLSHSADVAWPDFICAATDGIAKSFRNDPAFTAAVAQLRRNALADWKGLVAALPDWLSDLSERGSGDDCTICIALNTMPVRDA